SATMPPEITRLTKQFLNDPTRIEAAKPATTNENIAQYLVPIPLSEPAAKRATLRELVGRPEIKNGIVFCNRKSEVDVVAKSLRTHGFDAAAIHGDLDQTTRMRTLDSFRKGELRFLVASDVAARGLDIPDVSHVFNYDVPHHADDYVHRIGRTGRAGRSGETFMISTPADARSLDKVLKLIGKAPQELKIELDWDEARARGERQRARSAEKDRGGRRGERSGRRGERPRRGETAAVAAEADNAQAVESQSPAPRPRRETDAKASPAHASARPRGRAEPKARPPSEDHDDARVRGFGADTPAFLLRPAPKV
ncbi:MAG: DEAD/DEAH box helicase, partial [Caulobacteraceae bacterium]|nr:DEAD/DEAH box helicase [Caulobacteraceae bacterium]